MATTSIDQFEEQMRRELEKFSSSRSKPSKASRPTRSSRPEINEPTRGLKITLGVKKRRLAIEEPFTVQTQSISRLEAKIEAEHAARKAGWNIVSHVISYGDEH
tara:strand:+ start:5152 stop:5463 length:312 start_codon:yes stop_codon:yes gene_type:complete